MATLPNSDTEISSFIRLLWTSKLKHIFFSLSLLVFLCIMQMGCSTEATPNTVIFTLLFYFSDYCFHISVAHLSLSLSPPPGNEPQTEKQVEKASTLSLVRRDTALMLRDFRQGASNWFHSLLDHNRDPAPPSTAAEAPPGATGKPPSVHGCCCAFICSQPGPWNEVWVGSVGSVWFARQQLCSKLSVDAICLCLWSHLDTDQISVRGSVACPCFQWSSSNMN